MRSWFLLTFILVFASAARADLIQWDNFLSLEDKQFNSTFIYDRPIENPDYFVFARIYGVTVVADDMIVICDVEDRGIGTSIKCNDINSSKITYNFFFSGLITTSQD